MAPKKRKAEENQPTIRGFLMKKHGDPGSSCSTTRKNPEVPENKTNLGKAKKEIVEEVGTSEVDHLHHFKVKFYSDGQKYTVDCNQPRTVLEVIKSHLSQQFKENIKGPEENIILKSGEGNDSHIVPTHFPCSCVEEEECLTVTTSAKVVEQKQAERKVLPRENYSVFFIDKEGGKYTKTKTDMIFRCNNIFEQFRYFCVYGRKGTTVVETLRLDGRFKDFTDFNLSDNKTGDLTYCTEIVDNLDGGKFQICLPKEGKTKAKDPKQQAIQEQDPTQQTSHEEQQEKASASINPQSKSKTTTVLEYAAKEGVSLKTAMEKSDCQIDLKEVYDLLQQQFPKLKELMEKRFPGRSFNQVLKLKKKNFGKIHQTFSKVYTMRQLFNLSESICLLEIKDTFSNFKVEGTGFVLLDNLVLTNAHLFKPFQKGRGKNWLKYLNISATFKYENPDSKSTRTFQAKMVLVGNPDVDYALLELICRNQTSDQTETERDEIPPGLLKRFGPVPEPGDDGGACIIGHPAGGVREWDVTCIIRKEDREQAVTQNLEAYKDYLFTVCSINHHIKTDPYADIRVTYNSFMYHGSSGSPVFDPFGRVFGFHTGGFFFGHPRPGHSVIEFAFPLLYIFKMLLGDLQKIGRKDILEKVLVEAQGNGYLEEIIDRVGLNQNKDQAHCVENQERNGEIGQQSDSEEEMDTSS